jgi:hypothetical protein
LYSFVDVYLRMTCECMSTLGRVLAEVTLIFLLLNIWWLDGSWIGFCEWVLHGPDTSPRTTVFLGQNSKPTTIVFQMEGVHSRTEHGVAHAVVQPSSRHRRMLPQVSQRRPPSQEGMRAGLFYSVALLWIVLGSNWYARWFQFILFGFTIAGHGGCPMIEL